MDHQWLLDLIGNREGQAHSWQRLRLSLDRGHSFIEAILLQEAVLGRPSVLLFALDDLMRYQLLHSACRAFIAVQFALSSRRLDVTPIIENRMDL